MNHIASTKCHTTQVSCKKYIYINPWFLYYKKRQWCNNSHFQRLYATIAHDQNISLLSFFFFRFFLQYRTKPTKAQHNFFFNFISILSSISIFHSNVIRNQFLVPLYKIIFECLPIKKKTAGLDGLFILHSFSCECIPRCNPCPGELVRYNALRFFDLTFVAIAGNDQTKSYQEESIHGVRIELLVNLCVWCE